jgi:hypothetical protein
MLDKNWSLTDCISIEILKEFNIKNVLTADNHSIKQVLIHCFDDIFNVISFEFEKPMTYKISSLHFSISLN